MPRTVRTQALRFLLQGFLALPVALALATLPLQGAAPKAAKEACFDCHADKDM